MMTETVYDEAGLDFRDWCVAESQLPYSDLSYAVNGALMKVHRELGPGWDEADYHLCFLDELSRLGIPFESKCRGVLLYRGAEVDRFELDVLVDSKLVVELKHALQGFAPSNYVQLINYLTFWRKTVGLLCNFGQESLRFRRLHLPGTIPELRIHSSISTPAAESCRRVAAVVEALRQERLHTYFLPTLKRLFEVEARAQRLSVHQLVVQPKCLARRLSQRAVDAWLIENDTVLSFGAHPTGPAPQNQAILRSYLNQSGVPKGILVNFAPTVISICPVALQSTP